MTALRIITIFNRDSGNVERRDTFERLRSKGELSNLPEASSHANTLAKILNNKLTFQNLA